MRDEYHEYHLSPPVKGFLIGVAFATLLTWLVRHWKLVLFVVACLYVYDKVDAFFSPMTKDLSGQIAEEYKNIKVLSVGGSYWRNDQSKFEDPYFLDDHVHGINMTIKNTMQARLLGVSFDCFGIDSKQPPDRSYKPEVHHDEIRYNVTSISVAPGDSATVGPVDDGRYIESDLKHLTCKVDGATFDNAGFYRSAGEIDRYGLAGIEDHMESWAGNKPTTYQGSSYPINVGGSIVNHYKSTIVSLNIACTYLGEEGDEVTHNVSKQIDGLSIAPGQTYKLSATLETFYTRPSKQECHLTRITYK